MTDPRRRVRQLTLAGATDSFGLACGWTVFNLLAVYRYGLGSTGLLNAAMLVGVALAAPAAGRVTRRLSGRAVLQSTAAVESVLRAGALALIYWNAPLAALVPLVAVMNVVAWTGYAAMRAEVASVHAGAAAMTRYVATIVGVEAVGATLAALLPITSAGGISPRWVGAVTVVYGLTLLPTAIVGRSSQVRPHGQARPASLVTPGSRRLLLTGAVLMVLCSGPTLLFVGLAAELHGKAAVAGAAIAFAAGSLLAPAAGRMLARTRVSARALWPIWGAGMVLGWAVAPWSVEGLWLAQLMSGVCLTGFEGAMDHRLAGGARDGTATAALARGSATRALGGAASVRLVPLVATAALLPRAVAVSVVLCLAAACVLHASDALRRRATVALPMSRRDEELAPAAS